MFGRKLSCTYFLPSKVPADILHCGRLLHSKSSSESTSSFFTIKHGCLNFDTCKVGIYFTNSNFVIAVAFLAKNASSRHPAHWLKYAQCIGMVTSSLTICLHVELLLYCWKAIIYIRCHTWLRCPCPTSKLNSHWRQDWALDVENLIRTLLSQNLMLPATQDLSNFSFEWLLK